MWGELPVLKTKLVWVWKQGLFIALYIFSLTITEGEPFFCFFLKSLDVCLYFLGEYVFLTLCPIAVLYTWPFQHLNNVLYLHTALLNLMEGLKFQLFWVTWLLRDLYFLLFVSPRSFIHIWSCILWGFLVQRTANCISFTHCMKSSFCWALTECKITQSSIYF